MTDNTLNKESESKIDLDAFLDAETDFLDDFSFNLKPNQIPESESTPVIKSTNTASSAPTNSTTYAGDTTSASTNSTTQSPPSSSNIFPPDFLSMAMEMTGSSTSDEISSTLGSLMEEMSDPEFIKAFEKHADLKYSSAQKPDDYHTNPNSQQSPPNSTPAASFSDFLSHMQQSVNEVSSMDSDSFAGVKLPSVEDIFGQGDFHETMMSMISEILSPDVMKETVQEICSVYPKWIQDNSQQMTPSEKENYLAQLELWLVLKEEYDIHEKPDIQRVMDLMGMIQAKGAPPSQVLKILSVEFPLDINDSAPESGPQNPELPFDPKDIDLPPECKNF